MTSLSAGCWLGAGIVGDGGTGARLSQTSDDPLAPLLPEPGRPGRSLPAGQLPPRIAPAALRDRLTSLGRAFNGRAGISVVLAERGLAGRL